MSAREYHGMCRSKVYRIWTGMKNRCQNPNNAAFHNYGARGIEVCPEWESFSKFLSDMGEPKDGETLDRIDNELGYSKANCRWATRTEQGRNRRANHFISVGGETKLLCDWAQDLGISHCTILRRIKIGWTVEEAVTTPKITHRKGIRRGLRIKDHQAYGDEHGVKWSHGEEIAA